MNIEGNLALKEEPLEELIDGKLVMMAPPISDHNAIVANLAGIFAHYLRGKKCRYYGDHEGVYLADGHRYIPDGMIICDRSKIKHTGVYGAPDLVIEVLSPSTARNDRGRKKDLYEQSGVREYWIVNPSDMSIEQYILQDGKFVLRDVYHKYASYELEEMTDEERAAIVTEFRCSLYDDLTIFVDDVFDNLLLSE
ncbi:MAG: Uma2 family endonuclease [Oscillibacter sp.]|nr:Uma2 family endonuclease [Oscillibacter sp.]MBQ9618401.1 Uma2 family endonuclease [Oscillibacter sp.]